MMTLALDTTSEAGGVAIYNEDACLARIVHQGAANQYSVALFEMTKQLVTEVSARSDSPLKHQGDIDLYAVANGPGSFTGIRVGVAATLAWAKVYGKPAQGVSVLEALADVARPATKNAMVILNAYRGEFYVGEFRRNEDGQFAASAPGRVWGAEELREFAAGASGETTGWTWVVRAHDKPATALREALPGGLNWQVVEGTVLDSIARLARRAALEGRLGASRGLDAYYIRRTDAEINFEK